MNVTQPPLPLFTLAGEDPATGSKYWRYRCVLCGAAGRGEGRHRALHAYHAHYRRRHR